jgi:hypothetical protein
MKVQDCWGSLKLMLLIQFIFKFSSNSAFTMLRVKSTKASHYTKCIYVYNKCLVQTLKEKLFLLDVETTATSDAHSESTVGMHKNAFSQENELSPTTPSTSQTAFITNFGETTHTDQLTEGSRSSTQTLVVHSPTLISQSPHPQQNQSAIFSPETDFTPSNDFGIAVALKERNQLSSGEIMFFMNERWKPKNQSDLPVSTQKRKGGEVKRRLNTEHLARYPWLAVSRHPDHEGLWCSVCVLMRTNESGGGWSALSGGGGGQKMGKLVLKPLKDYSKLTGKDGALTNHAEAQFHKHCQEKAAALLTTFQRGSQDQDIRNALDCERVKQIQQNRALLRSVVETVKLCGAQNIPLRGHRDDGKLDIQDSDVITAVNDGNFRHLLRYRIQSGDSQLKNLLENAPSNAKYTSKQIQNELIGTIGEMIKTEVVRKANKATVWCLLADESTDRQTRELMVIVCRYVCKTEQGYVIREDPFAVVDAFQTLSRLAGDEESDDGRSIEEKLDGKSLGKLLLSEVRKSNLDLSKCVGQGYDKAASMASLTNGAAAEVKRQCELADYFHCVSHATNLSCSKIVSVPILRNAQDVVRDTISHFSSSAKRTRLLKKHLIADKAKTETLVSLCTTRFVERHEAISRFWDSLPSIVSALQEMEGWHDREASSRAYALRSCIEKSDTLVGLVCLNSFSSIMKPLAESLQQKDGDLVRALSLISSVKAMLEDMRSHAETKFRLLYEDLLKMAEKIDATIKVTQPRIASRSTYRAGVPKMDPESHYRMAAFIPALDAMLLDFTERFSCHFTNAAKLSALIPAVVNGKRWEDVQPGYEKYKELLVGTEIDVKTEFEIWNKYWSKETVQKPKTAISALNSCQENVFPNIFALLTILATLPVSTCEAERMFSKVDRTCSSIRSTMTEERLEALLLMQTYRDELPKTDDAIDMFALRKARRLSLVV